MYQFFAEPDRLKGGRAVITGSDVNHIKNVLRMKEGGKLIVRSGSDGREYLCRIAAIEEEEILCEILSAEEKETELPAGIHLFQGLPKGDKMEFIIQKAVELGADEIIPVAARRCVVRLDEKKAEAKVRRWQAIAEAAAKQSRRSVIPQVAGVMSFDEAVRKAASMDRALIPYELAEGMERTKELIDSLGAGQEIAVFIGPEGGFEEEEIRKAAEAGIEPVTLGRRILRTETAGLAVLSWIMYRLEK